MAQQITIEIKFKDCKHKSEPKKPISPKNKRVSKRTLGEMLDDISMYLLKNGSRRFAEKRALYKNTVNEEACDYDERFFEYSGFDKCLRDSGKLGRCYCAKCLMEEMLALEMIADNSNFITDIHGNKLRPVCRYIHDPIVLKRGDRYYLLVRSNVSGFNSFHPIVDVLKNFY